MINEEEIRQNWNKINEQLKEVKRYLEEDKSDEALYFTWLAAENIINNLKVAINGFYLKDHKGKSDILKEYFIKNLLKKDYSKIFKKLSKYRIVAEFHPYTSIPKDYTKKDVIGFFTQIKELEKEVADFLIKKNILRVA